MFKYYLIIILFFSFLKEEESIAWNEEHRLEWSDFKGTPEQDSDAAAITASGLTFSFSARTTETRLIDFSTSVVAHFYPNQSWYIKAHASNIILAHEQLHFDITELHARKLKHLIANANFSENIKEEIAILHEQANKELKEMQNKYDTESNYSRNVDPQKSWQIYIRKELKKLSKYK